MRYEAYRDVIENLIKSLGEDPEGWLDDEPVTFVSKSGKAYITTRAQLLCDYMERSGAVYFVLKDNDNAFVYLDIEEIESIIDG